MMTIRSRRWSVLSASACWLLWVLVALAPSIRVQSFAPHPHHHQTPMPHQQHAQTRSKRPSQPIASQTTGTLLLLLFADTSSQNASSSPAMEQAWRYTNKILLRIGAKGATATHGNSLRQLLLDHTAVKVKINTAPYDGSFETAFEKLKELAVASGASSDLELLQYRSGEQVLLVALPGTRARIEAGEFPPPAKPEETEDDE